MNKMAMFGTMALCAGSVLAQEVKPVPAWDTTVAAGVNLSRGNTRNMLVNGSVVSACKREKNEVKVGVEVNYGETEVTTTNDTKKMDTNVQNSRAFMEYHRLLNERTYAYLNSEIRNDDIANLDYRLMVGPGMGQSLLKSDTQTLGVELGISYIQEQLAGVKADDYLALRVAEKYELKMSGTAKVWQSFEYLPDFEDFGRYLLNAELGAEAAMNARLSLRIVAQDKYNSEPAVGRKPNDFQLIGGLTYKL
jgi:putative salt-induced outer membrane protein YdiY